LPDPPAIACRGVVRTYRAATSSVAALDAVDAQFPAGVLTAVVGPSGCGKSTLLRLLGGIDRPDAGTIEVGGIEVSSLSPGGLRRYRRDVAAFVAQHAAANLVPHLTIAEQAGGRDGAALVHRLGLGHCLRARAQELSGGEQARAALAVGLARRTSVVLLDEPTAELDRTAADRVIQVLRDVTSSGRTVVVATHDPNLVAAAAGCLMLVPPTAQPPDAIERRRGGSRTPVLTLRGVTKSYGGRRVVDEASLELAAGELGVLLGRSGSGKSTLLMLAGGWIRPDAGEVTVPGGRRGAPPAWTETSYLAQRFGLLAELSVAENVELPIRLRRDGGRQPDHSIADRLAVLDVLGREPLETSLGQQQRIALARALAVPPALLLADEPTSHQDPASAERVWASVRRASDGGSACLVATHDERLAARADRVWLIEDGRVRRG
jgi:putative ABC transport system ATP-binding protein